ncbi:MAG: DUF4340 domain-containing protein [Methylophilaceae bacterium]|nr:DUF4340 domain-containing protein [Methyloradius sp.]
MKSRWIVNLVLLLLVAAIITFLYFRPMPKEEGPKTYEISSLKLADFNKVSIEFPAKAPVVFEKTDGNWRITQPFDARADMLSVQRILSVVAATTTEKFALGDPSQFGLDQPKLKLKLNDEEFLFGTINPVSGEQYVQYKDSVYLVQTTYSESAGIQIEEMMDKSPFKPGEKPTGFDLSRLEQWEDSRLQVGLTDGKWTTSVANAKLTQNEMNEWFDEYWKHMAVTSVERYTPDRRATYPSLEVKLEGGAKVHFDKMQESPEIILGRPDEGVKYHMPPDSGFTMLNPPVTLAK